MPIELLVQFLVLGATAFLFWLARRDLTAASRAAPPADTQEWEQLCETLEALVTDLAGRVERLERQIAQAVPPAPMEAASESPRAKRGSKAQTFPTLPAPVPSLPMPEPDEPPDAHYAPVYALLETGLTDPQEIARQTGLSRGEVELILSLRAHRAI